MVMRINDLLEPTAVDLPLIPAATLILLQDTAEGIEVLMLQRQKTASFLPKAWVFPGGIVEAQDETHDEWQTAAQAAVRECFEETGLLIDKISLLPFARWIAPIEATKRFDTRFFIAPFNQALLITLQESEVAAFRWLTPKDAITLHRQDKLSIIPPTLVSLELLKTFSDTKAAIDHFSRLNPRTFVPKVCFWQEQTFMLYQDDVAYNTLDMQLTGKRQRCHLEPDGWHYIED